MDLAEWIAALVIVAFGGLVALLYLRRERAKQRSSQQAVIQASNRTSIEQHEAARRAAGLAGRGGQYEQVFIYDERARNTHTYRAAYELMVRGVDAKLYAKKPGFDFGLTTKNKQMSLRDAICYTTERLAPYLTSIGGIGAFAQYVPYRRDHHLALVVHQDDLQEAYDVLLELGIRRVGNPEEQRGRSSFGAHLGS